MPQGSPEDAPARPVGNAGKHDGASQVPRPKPPISIGTDSVRYPSTVQKAGDSYALDLLVTYVSGRRDIQRESPQKPRTP